MALQRTLVTPATLQQTLAPLETSLSVLQQTLKAQLAQLTAFENKLTLQDRTLGTQLADLRTVKTVVTDLATRMADVEADFDSYSEAGQEEVSGASACPASSAGQDNPGRPC